MTGRAPGDSTPRRPAAQATDARAARRANVDWRDVLYTVRKLIFRGEEATRAAIAAELQATGAEVTVHLLRACAAGLLRMTERPDSSGEWALTEAGERALSAHVLDLQVTRPRSPLR